MNAPFGTPVQVRQLAQYPRITAVEANYVALLQSGEPGAPYVSILASDLVASALAGSGRLQLNSATGGIVFGPPDILINAVSGSFVFSAPIVAPSVDAPFLYASSITVNGVPVATQADLASVVAHSVTSFNQRTGDILLDTADIMRAGGAPQESPVFSGWVIAPSHWDVRINDDTVVTANWVHRVLDSGCYSVRSFNGRVGNVVLQTSDVNAAYAVPGSMPTAPNPVLGDSSNRIATTSFVDESITDAIQDQEIVAGVSSFNTRTGAVTLTTADVIAAGGAVLASPAFTGIPTAPTQPATDNSTALATTAFVHAAGATAGGGIGININTLTSSPLVPDGVTSNVAQFMSLAPVLQSVGPEFPVPVTITVGSPTVIALNTGPPSGGTLTDNTHFLKPNQAFRFTISAGGSLPSGIDTATTYYITSANLLGTSFTFSVTNNYGQTGPSSNTTEGTSVNTTGTLTGTASIILTGRDLNISIPPGPYFCGVYGDANPNITVVPNGISRIRFWAYGAMFDTKISFGPWRFMADARTWTPQVFDLIRTTPTEIVQSGIDAQVTLLTIANAANYYVGQWISVFGLDLQNPLGTYESGPPNNQYQEYKKIKAINLTTGVLTLDGTLRWVYLSTFPNLFNAPGQIGGGAALIAQMHPAWDTQIEVHGARWVGEPAEPMARIIIYDDCVFQGYGNFAAQFPGSVTKQLIYRNCRFGPAGVTSGGTQYYQVDKMFEYLEFDHCTMPNKFSLTFYSVCLHQCLIKNLIGYRIAGTPRQIRVVDSELDTFLIGPLLGVTSGVEASNNRITYFDMQQRTDDLSGSGSLSVNNDMTLVANWTFSNGTFTRNITGLPVSSAMSWQIPGAKIYFADASRTYTYFQNMGAPFTILNTYMDASGNFSFDTTLTAVPTRQASSVVTLTIASPGVVNWTAHGLAANTVVVFTVAAGGALPTGLSRSTLYYVIAPTANSFEVATAANGTPINFTGTTTGAVTAYSNPLAFRPHPCPRFTGANNTGSANLVDLNGAVDEPMFSRVKRAFVGKMYNGTWSAFLQPNPRIWGNLISMTITVLKASTAGTLNINCPGFVQGNPPSLLLSTFNQTVDLTQAGRRVVTNTAVTGNLGADALTAYADWVAGPLVFTPAGVPQTLQGGPLVLFEMLTDQGITRFSNMAGAPGTPAASSFVWQYIDSGIIQQYGSLPQLEEDVGSLPQEVLP